MKRIVLILMPLLLSSCVRPSKGVLSLTICDFDSYDSMLEDWNYENSFIDEKQLISFDLKLTGFDTTYHISGVDYTDGFVMDGEIIQDGRKILGDRTMYIENHNNRQNIFITFPFTSGRKTDLSSLKWVLIAEAKNNNLVFTENKLSSERVPYIGGSPYLFIDELYTLTNGSNERLLYVAFNKTAKVVFDDSMSLLENKFMEAYYA